MTIWKAKAEKKKEELTKRYCEKFIEDLPISQAAKDELQPKCEVGFIKRPHSKIFEIMGDCIDETDTHEDFQKCMGSKSLNPKSVLYIKPVTPEVLEEIGVCESESLKATDKPTEQEFRSWCYAGINPPKVEFNKGIRDQITKDISDTSKLILTSSATEQSFHTPLQAVKKTGMGKKDQVQDMTLPSTHTITITKIFGLEPCDEGNTVTPQTFSRFEIVTNHLIRAGASLHDNVFKRKGGKAAKDFYDITRKTPSMDALWQWRDTQSFQLKERAWRCAAQPAYFALRDYKTRLHLLHHFIDTLQSLPDATLIFDSKFPQNVIFSAVYSTLPQLGMKLTKGQVSRVYLGNVLRWMRNLVKRGFRTKYGQVVATTFNSQPNPPHLAYELAHWLARDLPKFLDAYLRTLSRRLTWQVKRTLHSSRKTLPKNKTGASIRHILQRNILSMKTLDVKSWERARKSWREETKEILEGEFKSIDVATLATHAVQEGQTGLTPERIVNLLFNFRSRRIKLGAGELAEFKAYLVHRAVTELEYRRISLLKPRLAPTVQQILNNLLVEPRAWLKLPHFQKQTIPFGADDTRVYHDEDFKDLYILACHKQGVTIEEIIHNLLRKQIFKRGSEKYQKKMEETREYIEKLMNFDKKNNWLENIKKRNVPIRLQLRLEVRNPMWFELRTPKRFLKLVQTGYAPQKATLLKKRGGGLILAIPFEKEVPKSQCLGRSDLTLIQDPLIIAGLDPGLKTWATLSIGIRDKLVAGVWGQAGQEIARYFYDQKQYGERRTEWFKPLKNKMNPPDYKNGKFPNLKRRLTNLQRELRRCQSERDEYRYACRRKGNDYRHKQKFFELNRRVKQIWDSISALHDELTRQIATCILAACEHHRVNILRIEDLRWSKPSKKYEVNYFLASNQIHWFFGQIQARIADLAPRKGIFVEWVKAKYTSSRCSKCGHIGKIKAERKKARKGKIFKCPECGFQLDADLNAARNIRVAPISKNIPPSLYAWGGGSPYNPLSDDI
ncbi:MAG: transposase [Candidatus Helarchaeota archaeon]|nr:transposase [Candidatus Helarchaeota archaeon]